MSLTQLSRILDLPDEQLKQITDYAATLSKAEAAEHFTNLLGDSPQVVEFISSFNARRIDPKALATAPSSAPGSDIDGVPRQQHGRKKKKPQIHTPAPRQVTNLGPAPGTAYNKKDQNDDYIPRRSGTSTPTNSNVGPSTSRPPPAKSATPSPQPSSKPPPPAVGTLVSELGLPKAKPRSTPVSRTSTPGPGTSSKNNGATTKVSIAGGVPMHGASTALTDLDQAIRQLEITTNPSHASNSADGIAARRCNCVATRHALLAAAPNCLNCGKVICVKEGLGPCTSCGEPLLSTAEVQGMIKELRAERGREKMAADREAHKKADIGSTPRPFTSVRGRDDLSVAEAMALEHRDKLLGFQAQNAKRTTVRDEAADFDVSLVGNMWASPEERARELKKQQKLLREMEWNAKPEYEKRPQVVSIDLVGKKVFKKMAAVERPPSPREDDELDDDAGGGAPVLGEIDGNRGSGGGAFSKNPLLGGMIKPVYDVKGHGAELERRKDRSTRWRRVQDDLEDNEAVILDGGIYGGRSEVKAGSGGDEPDCG
ncbi:activating signal cointegrator 1 [Diplogelasinospora grovesii]|uniref:Activating signal cointegrator 1 n=1 Tax=Diplogelasinospora grovesii TaxID=303347 RepID=A0AAN6N3W1_9PEZI|nr:activating signal cointegrator 1 [Diplogelasinospora grovesii]